MRDRLFVSRACGAKQRDHRFSLSARDSRIIGELDAMVYRISLVQIEKKRKTEGEEFHATVEIAFPDCLICRELIFTRYVSREKRDILFTRERKGKDCYYEGDVASGLTFPMSTYRERETDRA